MPNGNGMNGIEGRLFALYFQDGLWDIMIGWLLLVTALRSFIDHWSVSFLIFAGVLFAILMRKYVTMGRIGYAKFGTRRRMNRKKVLFIVIGANLLTLLILIITMIGIGPSTEIWGFAIAVAVLIIFSAVAYMMNYRRFFIWGLLFSGGILINEMAGEEIGKYAFVVLGSIVTLVGLFYLLTFFNKYPNRQGD